MHGDGTADPCVPGLIAPAPGKAVLCAAMARPTQTDTSPAGLRAAADADIVATRLYNGDFPLEPHEEVDVAWAVPAEPSEMRSVVAWADFEFGLVERRLDELLEALAPWRTVLWWLAPHHGPADLEERLARRGFAQVDDIAAMGIGLDQLPRQVDIPAGVRIELVDDPDDVEVYVGLLLRETASHHPMRPDAGAARRRHLLARLGNDPDSRRYVAWLDGRPVATSRLSMAGGAAGLYTVVTMPEARGRGIGTATTLTALLAGREAGMRIGVLQATDMGIGIYRRLGFQELFRYALLARPAGGVNDRTKESDQ